MNEYLGKTCPFCKSEFIENDDIVICSDCNMPHHKECWAENQGCSTFGCTGTIKKAYSSQNSVTTTEKILYSENNASGAKLFCTRCEYENASNSAFCASCGNKLTASQSDFTPAPATVDPDVAMLIGRKDDYYITKFLKLKSTDQKITWNWPAFLITPYWFFYRKMYAYGGATLGIVFLLTLILGTGANIVTLLGYIAVGLLGNYIYMLHLEKLSGQMKTMDQFAKQQFAEKKGGVNIGLAIGIAVVYAVIVFIFSL